jgi:membrane protein implicated in regulation of membrane protease activity
MAWTAALLGAMFLWMVEGSARVATGAASRLAVWPILLVVGVILLSLIPYAIASRRRIERMMPTGDQTTS